jgi:hypothetical protein
MRCVKIECPLQLSRIDPSISLSIDGVGKPPAFHHTVQCRDIATDKPRCLRDANRCHISPLRRMATPSPCALQTARGMSDPHCIALRLGESRSNLSKDNSYRLQDRAHCGHITSPPFSVLATFGARNQS